MLLQGMTNNVKFTFSVRDTIWVGYNLYWARQIELVILSILCSVVTLVCISMVNNYQRVDHCSKMSVRFTKFHNDHTQSNTKQSYSCEWKISVSHSNSLVRVELTCIHDPILPLTGISRDFQPTIYVKILTTLHPKQHKIK